MAWELFVALKPTQKVNSMELATIQTGSRLYGFHRPDSDYDSVTIVMEPVNGILGLEQRFEVRHDVLESVDNTFYGFQKFMRLALQCNPNILDVIFAPPNKWYYASKEWRTLYHSKDLLLSTDNVRNRYIGYALSQLKKLELKPDSKHQIHMERLLINGYDLLTTGNYNPVVGPYPFNRSYTVDDLKNAYSVLPDKPNIPFWNDYMHSVYRSYLASSY